MKQNSLERFAVELTSLLKRIYDYWATHTEKEQPFGACTVNPKHAAAPLPTQEIQAELERRATEFFTPTKAIGYYFRYWTPPMLPVIDSGEASKPFTVDDYQMTLELPRFDDKWQQTVMARSLIYCPLDQEQHGWSDWFELQHEAVRLTPLLHKTLKELKIRLGITVTLGLPGRSIFESFVYDYAIHDANFPEMTKQEREQWRKRKVDWKVRYHLAVDVIKPATTLKDLYTIARKKAASSRNPTLKSLFWAFVDHVERRLIKEADLPEEEKKSLISQLREVPKRASKGKYRAKRPAVCISDVECGQVLYLLMQDFLNAKTKNKALAEAILFVWIAQHAAFSGLHLKVEDILSIRVTDIDHHDLTIIVRDKEANITEGLNEILTAWLGESEKRNKKLLFQTLTYDTLEDIIGKCSVKFYGVEGKLLPRDFLERVHVVAGARIPLELRRQIAQQEELIKDSPYRIHEREIKKQIMEAIQKNKSQKAS
jgi:hypothetical protein